MKILEQQIDRVIEFSVLENLESGEKYPANEFQLKFSSFQGSKLLSGMEFYRHWKLLPTQEGVSIINSDLVTELQNVLLADIENKTELSQIKMAFEGSDTEFLELLIKVSIIVGTKHVISCLTNFMNNSMPKFEYCLNLSGVRVGKASRQEVLADSIPQLDLNLNKILLSDERHLVGSSSLNFTEVPILSFSDELLGVVGTSKNQRVPRSLVDMKLSHENIQDILEFCKLLSLNCNKHIMPVSIWKHPKKISEILARKNEVFRREFVEIGLLHELTPNDIANVLILCQNRKSITNGSIDHSINYWVRSLDFTRDFIERMINLRMALDFLFLCNHNYHENSQNRVARYGAWFLGQCFNDRQRIFDGIRRFYQTYISVLDPKGKGEEREPERKLHFDVACEICRDGILKILETEKIPDWNQMIILGESNGSVIEY